MALIRAAIFTSLIVVVGALASACETPTAEAACTAGSTECLPKVALMDTTNEVHPPEALAGNVVVINFWATWCKPCKKEIPEFNRVYLKYKDRGVKMFGILTEDASSADLLNFASDHEMTYPIVRLENEIARAYDFPPNIPVTFIYDKKGRRALHKVGTLSEAELSAQIEKLLAQP